MLVTDVRTKGLAEVLAAMGELPEKPMRAVLRKGLRAATAEVRKSAKRRTPKDTGALRAAIGSKVATTRDKRVVGIVGARTDEKFNRVGPDGRTRKPSKYIHLVELGTKTLPPVGMLRSALDSTRSAQLKVFADKAKPEFRKQVNKLRAKRRSLF